MKPSRRFISPALIIRITTNDPLVELCGRKWLKEDLHADRTDVSLLTGPERKHKPHLIAC